MIHIFVRHCESVNSKERPEWFDKEKAFKNLLETAKLYKDNPYKVTVTVLLDTDLDDSKHFSYAYPNVNVIAKKGGTDAHSFLNLLDYIEKQKDVIDPEDIIYILEDDYIHLPEWPKILLEGFDLNVADYVTLYDHPDKYDQTIYKGLQSNIYKSQSTYWRSTPSTTNTYAMKYKTLFNSMHIHRKYSDTKIGYTFDHDKFLHLGKIGYKLISCIHGRSTHVESKYLSPFVDWQKVLEM